MEQVEGERAEKERKITFPSDSLLSVFSLRPSFDVAVALFLFFFRVSFSPAGNVRRPSCLDAAMAGRGEEPCGMLNHRVSHLCGKGRERASERERERYDRASLSLRPRDDHRPSSSSFLCGMLKRAFEPKTLLILLPLSPEFFLRSLDRRRGVGGTDAAGSRAGSDREASFGVESSPSSSSGFLPLTLSLSLFPSPIKTSQKPSASDKSSSGFVNSAWSAGGGSAAPGTGTGASPSTAGGDRSDASSSTSAAVAAAAASSALVGDNSSRVGGGGGGGWSTVTKGGGSSSSSQQAAANAAAAAAAAAAAPSQERKWAREERPSNSR